MKAAEKEDMKKKSDRAVTLIVVVLLLTGLIVMLYPTFSSWWNSRVQSRAISDYARAVGELDTGEKDRMLERARRYNEELRKLSDPFREYDKVPGYEDILDVTGTGIMGYIDIPKINVSLPVYHGTSPEVLNIAVGHMQGTSLPVGGKGTHAVISAHRGLPSARLFTDLDKLTEDDTFTITVLDEVMTYEVREILVIEPNQSEKLAVIPDADCVTLMTCTPYGINTHRLLIRSYRIDTQEPHTVRVPADAVQTDATGSAAVISVPVLILLLMFWTLSGRGKKRHKIDRYTIDELTKKGERNGASDDTEKKQDNGEHNKHSDTDDRHDTGKSIGSR